MLWHYKHYTFWNFLLHMINKLRVTRIIRPSLFYEKCLEGDTNFVKYILHYMAREETKKFSEGCEQLLDIDSH